MSDIYKKQVGGDHYRSMVIQPSEFINKNNLPFAEGNAIKYLCRHKQKNQKEDLLKAKHYIDMAIDRDYPEKPKEKKKPKLLRDELHQTTNYAGSQNVLLLCVGVCNCFLLRAFICQFFGKYMFCCMHVVLRIFHWF